MSDKLKAWREEARNNLSCMDSVVTESEIPWHRILKMIDTIEAQSEALQRMDSKDREEEKGYLQGPIHVRLAVVESYRKEAREALAKTKEILGD